MVGWIEVFRTGRHTDSAGQTREWTAADLMTIARQHDPARHETSIVLGHPTLDAPVYGWVEAQIPVLPAGGVIRGEDLIHGPGRAGSRFAGARGSADAVELIHHCLDERLLDVWRVRDGEFGRLVGGL
jgi:hypothetical protein